MTPEQRAEKIETQYADMPSHGDIDIMKMPMEKPEDLAFCKYGPAYKTGKVMAGTFRINQRWIMDIPSAMYIAQRVDPYLAEQISTGQWIKKLPCLGKDEREDVSEDIDGLHADIQNLSAALVSLALTINEINEKYDINLEDLTYYEGISDEK